jgi:uncharacterized GH25 family protein
MRKTIFFLLLAPASLAHEFWLAPASYRVAVGAAVPTRLLVGENLAGDTWPRPTRRVERFVRLGPAGASDSTDLRPALLADSLAPVLHCPSQGTHLVALVSRPAFSELPAAQFTAYLRAEGLDYALRQRQEADATTKPGREAYRRYAKALVLATRGTTAQTLESAADTVFRRVLGLPLELVPEQNPFRLRAGAALTVRVLRQGQPVPGALVQIWDASPVATAKNALAPPPAHFTTRTNAQGRVLLRLPGAGPYLLATVRIEPAPAALASRADWFSSWATLTFGGPAGNVKGYYSQSPK